MILFPIIFGILLSSTSSQLIIPNNYCDGIANGIFLPTLDNNCTDYYVCINNNAIRGKCPQNFTFNVNEQLCDLPYRTKCFQCPKNILKIYQLEKTCNKYILCFDGKPIIRQCLDGLQFNNITGRCDFAENLDCQENVCTKMNYQRNVQLTKSYSDCNKYYICYNGVPNPFYCAKGLHFNPLENECDLPSRAQCPIKIKSRAIIAPTNKLPIIPTTLICPSNGSHFLPDPKHPERYIYCLDGKSAVLICSPGLIYDKHSTECRLPENIQK